jgi:uncharacterized protein YjeT (DUF2065 family)
MTKNKWLKTGGIVGVIAGVVLIYFGGGSEGETIELVGMTFAAIGLITYFLTKSSE